MCIREMTTPELTSEALIGYGKAWKSLGSGSEMNDHDREICRLNAARCFSMADSIASPKFVPEDITWRYTKHFNDESVS